MADKTLPSITVTDAQEKSDAYKSMVRDMLRGLVIEADLPPSTTTPTTSDREH